MEDKAPVHAKFDKSGGFRKDAPVKEKDMVDPQTHRLASPGEFREIARGCPEISAKAQAMLAGKMPPASRKKPES